MADHTKIEWTDATWNPVTGCSVLSPGCTNCYAMRLAGTRLQHHPSRAGLTRLTKAGPVWTGEVRFNDEWLLQPLQWKRPRMIFVCAHADLFHESVPDEWIDRIFAVMALAPQHVFQVLTKRPERMRAYLKEGHPMLRWMKASYTIPGNERDNSAGVFGRPIPLPNVWLGTSVEDQQRADERIPHLLATPAAVRWLSMEPLLGPTYPWHHMIAARAARLLGGVTDDVPGIDWVVLGGESGPDARPMHPQWARDVRDQCAAAGVPFHFKQFGAWAPANGTREGDTILVTGDGPIRRGVTMRKVGKKAAGRLLDGVEHNSVPQEVQR